MSDAAQLNAAAITVDDVLITGELNRRASRLPDHAAEARALGVLAQELAANPGGVLQRLAELVIELCRADSAGVNILEPGGEHGILRWQAIAGPFAAHVGGTVPAEACPSGEVLARDEVLLFDNVERFYPAFKKATPRVYEYLLAAWHIDGKAQGTVWATGHSPDRRFDAEDARLLASLARFASVAHQMVSALEELQAELVRTTRLNAMGMMAMALAHELNQPLTAVTSYVETARAMLASADRETLEMIGKALDKAASEAMRAGQIVHRLREFVAHGDSDKRHEALPELINDAAGFALLGARDMGIRIDMQLAAGAAFVLVDRVQIQQVLVNLIRNAVEAMTDCPRRELTIRSQVEDTGMAEIAIADTGPGLAPAIVERLFQPLVSTKRQGMGLGLSICRTIIEAHCGRLWAEPNPGGGTVFAFTLPLEKRTVDDL